MHSEVNWLQNGNTVMAVGAEDVHTIARFETPALATQCAAEHNALAGRNPEALARVLSEAHNVCGLYAPNSGVANGLREALKALEGEDAQ